MWEICGKQWENNVRHELDTELTELTELAYFSLKQNPSEEGFCLYFESFISSLVSVKCLQADNIRCFQGSFLGFAVIRIAIHSYC